MSLIQGWSNSPLVRGCMLAAALTCLRMKNGQYVQLGQPITGTPLCVGQKGACHHCVGTRVERPAKRRHTRGYQRG